MAVTRARLTMDQTVSPVEEFGAALDCIIEEACDNGVSIAELVGVMTMQAQELTMISMGMLDADSEDEGEED